MRYTTKQARLCAAAAAYCAIHGVKSFTTSEVSEWIVANKLWPVPKKGDPPSVCAAWENQLDHLLAVGAT